jgi:hypothetical protein
MSRRAGESATDRYIRNVTDAMERRGHLEIKIENGQRSYKLTEAGQKYYSENQLDFPGKDPDKKETVERSEIRDGVRLKSEASYDAIEKAAHDLGFHLVRGITPEVAD